ncbi:MAG: hypothetical protein [Bacteriophage sp.]|nr:MAG: hypothetical protein [Bacteriophage sp.]
MYKYIYLSIDPGTNSLGTTINGITTDNQWRVIHSTTTNIDLLTKILYEDTIVKTHGMRLARMFTCEQVIYKFACDWNVNSVVSESPYMGRFPQAFSALVECMQSMRRGVYQYNPYTKFDVIDPSTIKKAVGVPGKSGDKNLMRLATQKLVGDYVNVDWLDEHSIDSICVGYTWFQQSYGEQW